MESLEPINSLHNISLGISPNECDIAIVSIDYAGTPGMLNSLVLKEYGYSIDDIPKQSQLEYGFGAITDKTRKSIIYVVTVKGENTIGNLENNLYKALVEFRGWIREKKTWLPLMGTGAGGLSLDESYSITARTINRFQEEYPTDTVFSVSIPNTPEGKKLISKFNLTQSNESLDAEIFVNAFKGKFYLVGSILNREDQLPRFFQDGIWEKGHDDDSYSSLISQVKKNDILIVKSTYASGSISYLRIKALGVVIESLEDGSTLSVDWKIKNISVDVENLGFYRNTIHEASPDDVIIILSRVDKDYWKKLVTTTTINSKKETIAGLISD